MKRFGVMVAATALLVGGSPGGSTSAALPEGTRVREYRGDLQFPVDLAWLPGTKKLFFTEKNTGRIRVMVGRRLLARPCADLDVESTGERGALGIVLHPRFRKNHFLYVYYTNREPLQNRVARFRVSITGAVPSA